MSRAPYLENTVMPVSKATLPFTQFPEQRHSARSKNLSDLKVTGQLVSNSTELQWQDRALVRVAAEGRLPEAVLHSNNSGSLALFSS